MAFPLSGTTSAKCFELLSFFGPRGTFDSSFLFHYTSARVPSLFQCSSSSYNCSSSFSFLSSFISFFFCFTNRISLLLLFVPSFVGDVKSTTSVCFVLFCFWANGFKKVHACLIFRCLLSKPRFLYERF